MVLAGQQSWLEKCVCMDRRLRLHLCWLIASGGSIMKFLPVIRNYPKQNLDHIYSNQEVEELKLKPIKWSKLWESGKQLLGFSYLEIRQTPYAWFFCFCSTLCYLESIFHVSAWYSLMLKRLL